MIALKSFLNTVFLNKILKKKFKTPPKERVEAGAFTSVFGSLSSELFGNLSNMEYFIHIKMENMLYGLWENFFIEFQLNSQQAFAYTFHFIRLLTL